MSDMSHTIVESWPAIKEDLVSFLSDTDAWIIAELNNALRDKDWEKILKLIEIMDSVHNLSHSHL